MESGTFQKRTAQSCGPARPKKRASRTYPWEDPAKTEPQTKHQRDANNGRENQRCRENRSHFPGPRGLFTHNALLRFQIVDCLGCSGYASDNHARAAHNVPHDVGGS